MLFRKTKKQEAENRKLRFIEGQLLALIRDVVKLNECNTEVEKNLEDRSKMIEYRAREILEWI